MKPVRLIKTCMNGTYSRVQVGKHLSDMFSIKNGFKQEYTLSPLLFNFALQYAIRKVQASQDGLKLKGKHQSLVHVDDVNMIGGSTHTIKRNKEALVAASNVIGTEVNAGKTMYKFMSRDQNAGHNQIIIYSSKQ